MQREIKERSHMGTRPTLPLLHQTSKVWVSLLPLWGLHQPHPHLRALHCGLRKELLLQTPSTTILLWSHFRPMRLMGREQSRAPHVRASYLGSGQLSAFTPFAAPEDAVCE